MEFDSAEILRDLLCNVSEDDAILLQNTVLPHTQEIVGGFYRLLMKDEAAKQFLSSEEVEKRLSVEMVRWIEDLLKIKSPSDVDAYVERQKQIGEIHARVHIPFHLLQFGYGKLKKQLLSVIVASAIPREKLTDAILLVNELLDNAFAVMGQTFIKGMVVDARDQQSLKLNSLGIELALQMEYLRASLFDWHRNILRLLLHEHVDSSFIPNISKTDFGLWVMHKGDLLFPDTPELSGLKKNVFSIDESYHRVLQHLKGGETQRMHEELNAIDHEVTSATQVLSTIAERTVSLENGRDPLTRLFNRRYLRAVLQKEVGMSVANSEPFGILIVDIDNFKAFNDSYGHDIGDDVLKQSAEVLLRNVRAGDYVFRYGGEEFLVVLAAVDRTIIDKVARKLVSAFRQYEFDGKGRPLTPQVEVTVSVGGALFNGHPDFEQTISKADHALFEAKRNGRNQYVIV